MSLHLEVPFNLDATLCCGQVFLWERRGKWWYGVIGDRVVKVRQTLNKLEFAGADEAFLKRYFGLDHDLASVALEIGKDEHIKAALREFWGLRLVNQEPWECLISFICATYKSVAAIQQMLWKLCKRFGEKLSFEGEEFHAFPSPEKLSKTSLHQLDTCGLGYRAKYVLETSKKVCTGGYNESVLRAMPYTDAKCVLQDFPGVGHKVADCVLLFSLGKLEAFPVDVWMKRVLLRHYALRFEMDFAKKLETQNGLSDSSYEKLNAFGRTYFGRFAGYAQEYLYHYERWLGNRKVEKPKQAIGLS